MGCWNCWGSLVAREIQRVSNFESKSLVLLRGRASPHCFSLQHEIVAGERAAAGPPVPTGGGLGFAAGGALAHSAEMFPKQH